MTARIVWSDELQALIDAQRMQDMTYWAEQDALDALRDSRDDMALDVLRAAQNAHDAAILCRVEAERNHKQWWERERAPGVPHSMTKSA